MKIWGREKKGSSARWERVPWRGGGKGGTLRLFPVAGTGMGTRLGGGEVLGELPGSPARVEATSWAPTTPGNAIQRAGHQV